MTQRDPRASFLAGEWTVRPELNALSRDGTDHHVEPKVMHVLLTLAEHPGHVVSKEQLIAAAWPNTFVGDDVLTRCISILRRVTEDSTHDPRFIQTVPKLGYRLMVPVSELPAPAAPLDPGAAAAAAASPPPTERRRVQLLRVGYSVALALVVAGVVLGALLLRRGRASAADPFDGSRTVQFTSFAGQQTQPAFSPKGDRIAFVLVPEDGSTRQVYIKKIGSEAVSHLAPANDEQFSPAWSPDGKRIAYLSRAPDGLGIYVVDLNADAAATAPPRKVFIPQQPSHWDQGALSWSPDGRYLIFPDHSGSQPDSSIFELNTATLDVHSITAPPPGWEGDLNPAFSPDGTKIAFTRASETAVRDIFWLSLTDGRLRQLTHDRMNIDSLAWSADGNSILFSSNRGGKYALWQMGLSGRQPQRLSVGTEDAFQPAVGPRPGELAYTQGSAIWGVERIVAPSARPGAKDEPAQETVVLASTQQDSAPSLAPDGRSFAVQSVRSGSQEIWVASIDGVTLRQLTFLGGSLTGSPSWSHAGDRILFDSRPDGHSHIFMVPAAGGRPRQITFGDGNDIIPRWSHDDRQVYFRSNRGGRWQLWKVAAAGGGPQPVTTLDGMEPQESPDGKFLYYTRGDEDGLWRIPNAGGAETRLLTQPSAEFWGYWEVTPWGLYYLDRTQQTPAIRVLDPHTMLTRTFATLKRNPPKYAGLCVGDGGRLVLATYEREVGQHITLVGPQR